MTKINEIVLSNAIKKLTGYRLGELVYDSTMEVTHNLYQRDFNYIMVDSLSESEYRDDYSTSSSMYSEDDEDDYYINLFKKKNDLEQACFGKENLVFINIDRSNNTYGVYFPSKIDSKANSSLGMFMFTITKGIEIVERSYDFSCAINTICFPRDCVMCLGDEDTWIYKVINGETGLKIIWNEKQPNLRSYNRLIMKTNNLTRLLVYKCIRRPEMETGITEDVTRRLINKMFSG